MGTMADDSNSYPFFSLCSQTAEHLREGIRQGKWTELLPGERMLAKQIGVSRRTLRSALNELQREGWVTERSRQGTRVHGARQGYLRERKIAVGLLLPADINLLRYRTILWIDDLRRLLYERQIDFHVFQKDFNSAESATRFLRVNTTKMKFDCWILPYSNQAMQQWCVKNDLPAVIVGSLHEDCELPNVDLDYRSLCQHAANQMLRQGHRHLALLLDREERGGDVESRKAFLEAVASSSNGEAKAIVLHHDGSASGIERLCDHLLAQPQRPTAWLVASPAHFLTVHTHLLYQRVSIPGDISLICRDADPYLSFCDPEPARYVFDIRQLAKHIARIVQKVSSGQVSFESAKIIADFIPGRTLGNPRLDTSGSIHR